MQRAHRVPVGRVAHAERRVGSTGCRRGGNIDDGKTSKMGDQLGEIEDDPEDAASGFENIYTEMGTQLDALEEALEEE